MSGRGTARAQRTPRAQQVYGILLATVIAVLLTLALIHWAACSQEVAMCALAAIPRRRAPILAALVPRWAGRLCARAWALARVACARTNLRIEQDLLDNMTAMRDRLPRQIADQSVRVGVLRVALIAAQNAARGDGA